MLLILRARLSINVIIQLAVKFAGLKFVAIGKIDAFVRNSGGREHDRNTGEESKDSSGEHFECLKLVVLKIGHPIGRFLEGRCRIYRFECH